MSWTLRPTAGADWVDGGSVGRSLGRAGDGQNTPGLVSVGRLPLRLTRETDGCGIPVIEDAGHQCSVRVSVCPSIRWTPKPSTHAHDSVGV